MERWKERDPIPALQRAMSEAGLLRPEDLAAIEAAAAREIDEAVAFAEASPEPPAEWLLTDVYRD